MPKHRLARGRWQVVKLIHYSICRSSRVWRGYPAVRTVRDGLSHEVVFEAIINAPAITKTLRARNPRSDRRETLYVIKGITFDGMVIYTKGKIATFEGREVFYVLISSKRSTDD
jgi:hypothetical protein